MGVSPQPFIAMKYPILFSHFLKSQGTFAVSPNLKCLDEMFTPLIKTQICNSYIIPMFLKMSANSGGKIDFLY